MKSFLEIFVIMACGMIVSSLVILTGLGSPESGIMAGVMMIMIAVLILSVEKMESCNKEYKK